MIKVPVHIVYANHCYTRSFESTTDSESDVLFAERKRNGYIDKRVFCLSRWNFSKQLPGIIENLADKNCFIGSTWEIFYGQELSMPALPHTGWYLCCRLSFNRKHQRIELSVRSSHYRSNRPNDIKGISKRFRNILVKFYTTKVHKK